MPTRTPDAPSADPAASDEAAGAGSRPAPAIPSFASLRDDRRRSAVDALFAGPAPAAPAPAAPPPATPAPAAPSAARPPAPVRPPEWADLWHLGVHVTHTVAGVPARLVRWQVRCLRTLLLGR